MNGLDASRGWLDVDSPDGYVMGKYVSVIPDGLAIEAGVTNAGAVAFN
jgi:hypothetical protein